MYAEMKNIIYNKAVYRKCSFLHFCCRHILHKNQWSLLSITNEMTDNYKK